MTDQRLRFRPAGLPGAFLAFLLAAGPALAQTSEYRLEPGDAIEFNAASAPDLRQKATVSIDGEVTLPLIGGIKAAGLTLAELRAQVGELVPTKVYRRRTEDGREYPVIISPSEITVTIAEYRPVYLNGDISKPGEQAFRPGLTVRQAVSLAGGYDIMRFRMTNPFLEQADLRSEYDTLWTQFAREQAVVLRLKAELENKAGFDRKALVNTPVPAALAEQIATLETEQLVTRKQDYEKEKAYLREAVKTEDGRIALLREQQAKEREGTDADAGDYDRVRELFQRGQVPITRLTDARRSVLLSSTRLLQTIAQLGQVERERQEYGRKLQRVDDTRRVEILRELQDAAVKLAGTQAKLQAVGDKLTYTSMVRSQLTRGGGAQPEIAIVRRTGGKPERIAANEDALLRPGDVVEVSLQAEVLANIPGQE